MFDKNQVYTVSNNLICTPGIFKGKIYHLENIFLIFQV
jgi:hypothetical protein